MLRVCRQRAVAIEPWSCGLFQPVRRARPHHADRAQPGRKHRRARTNHVYHFGRRELDALLTSYYLESGGAL